MTLYGIDVSNLNGPPALYRGLDEYQRAEFVIVQAIPRPAPNGLAAEQLRTAKADGKRVGIYSWIWFDPTWRLSPDVAEDQRRRLATVPDDVALDMRPWLDVEDNQSTAWQQSGLGQRIADVQRALEVLDEWAAARGLPPAGIYWSRYFVDLLFGGTNYWPDRVEWRAHYGITPGSLIGGNVVAHQFSSSPIDQNVMLESEIVQPGGEPMPDVDQGWQDKKQRVVTVAGELLAVADQIAAAGNRRYGPVRAEVLPLAEAVRDRAREILG